MANIIYYYKRCAAVGCTAPSNGTKAFCEPCYVARIASQRPCHNCNTTMVDIPQSYPLRLKRNLKKVYCDSCTQAFNERLENERRIEEERRDEERRIEKERLEKDLEFIRIRNEQKRLEKIRLEEERQKNAIRDSLYTSANHHENMVNYIFDLTKKIDELTKRLDEKPSEDS